MIAALVISFLAVWQIILVFRTSELLAPYRARLELRSDFRARLMRCSFCLSNWVAFIASAGPVAVWVLEQSPWDGEAWIGKIASYPAIALAVARLAGIGKDLSRSFDRTPRWKYSPVEGYSQTSSAAEEVKVASPTNVPAKIAPGSSQGDPTPQIVESFDAFCLDAFSRHLQLRSLSLVLDYRGDLNERIPGFVCRTEMGGSFDLAALVGNHRRVSELFVFQADKIVNMGGAMESRLIDSASELRRQTGVESSSPPRGC